MYSVTLFQQVSPPKSFQHEKTQCLSGVDWSRKGSIDAPIESLVHYVNQLPQYFTTSSCSGRICLYEQNAETESQKQGCRWLLTSHETVDMQQVVAGCEESYGDAYFKFEAFVMHIQCWRLEDAQCMHSVAVALGFRNSGITVGRKGKIIVAIRSTHGLEAPVTVQGKLLVDEKYITHLTKIANQKMEENISRIDRFFTNLKAAIENLESKTTTKTKQKLTAKKVDNTKISTNGHQKDSGDVTNSADIHQKVFGDVIQSTNSKLTNTCNNDEEVVEDCAFMFEET